MRLVEWVRGIDNCMVYVQKYRLVNQEIFVGRDYGHDLKHNSDVGVYLTVY